MTSGDLPIWLDETVVAPADAETREIERIVAMMLRSGADLRETALREIARKASDSAFEHFRSDAYSTDVARVSDAIAGLFQRARLLVFFGSGQSMLAGEALAQFTGWNIPGVGEPSQRKRPRTRIYDTFDPDTVAQVRESLDYERVGFVFVEDPDGGMTPSVLADIFVPELISRLGADEAKRRLAVIMPTASTSAGESSAVKLVSDAGGKVVEVGRGQPDAFASHPLAPAALAVGLARGADPSRIRSAAEDVYRLIASSQYHRDAEQVLAWSAWLGALRARDARADRPTNLLVMTTADRLARGSAWVATQLNHPALGVVTAAATQSTLGQSSALTGIATDRASARSGSREQFERLPYPASLMLLTSKAPKDVAAPDIAAIHSLAATWSDALAAQSVAEGRVVHRSAVSLAGPEGYGALAARTCLTAELIGPAVEIAQAI
ncbi:MAG: hypothetical protein AAFR23_01650 [Pseudomonadota bacterium]